MRKTVNFSEVALMKFLSKEKKLFAPKEKNEILQEIDKINS
jgi:hypothetical protein